MISVLEQIASARGSIIKLKMDSSIGSGDSQIRYRCMEQLFSEEGKMQLAQEVLHVR